MTIRRLFLFAVGAMTLFLAGFVLITWLMYENQDDLIKKNDTRYQSYQRADELRQSSDDLTRLARTYVVTGDPKYEQQYRDILAIRNGEKPRPVNYERVYWDFVAANGQKPRPDGEAVSLKKLMEDLGFAPQEFAKLSEAQANSDTLVKAETIAMNAVKGLFDDGTGNFTRKGNPDFELARKLMHSPEYHQEKAKIMKPVDEFFMLLEQRTQQSVAHSASLSKSYFQLMLLLIAGFVIFIAVFYWMFNRTVLGSVKKAMEQVNAAAQEIAQGSSDLAQRTEEQASSLEETASSMEELTSTVKNSADNAAQANHLATSARSHEQVNKAILQMDQVTQQNAALVEETAAASQSMGEQSDELQELMGFLKLKAANRAYAEGATANGWPAANKAHSRPQRMSRGRMMGVNDRAVRPVVRVVTNEKKSTTPAATDEWEAF